MNGLQERVAALGLRDEPWRIGAVGVSKLLDPALFLAVNGALPINRPTFAALHEYSTSLPTGTYEGKVWKTRTRSGWMLGRFGAPYPDDHEHAGQIPIGWWPLIHEGEPARWPAHVKVPLRQVQVR